MIRIKIKGRIQIRTKVTNMIRIRIRIKVMRIRKIARNHTNLPMLWAGSAMIKFAILKLELWRP
jgi:hypothetical protein